MYPPAADPMLEDDPLMDQLPQENLPLLDEANIPLPANLEDPNLQEQNQPEIPQEITPGDLEDRLDEEIVAAIKYISDVTTQADRDIRDTRIKLYKKLEAYWEGNQIHFWDDTIGDYRRLSDSIQLVKDSSEDIDVTSYAKVANIYKANVASIIAALTAMPPKVKYIPDDANNSADIETGKQYELIQKKIEKQKGTEPDQLITKVLKIKYNQGLVFAYVYPMEDPTLGYYSEPEVGYVEKNIDTQSCPNCGSEITQEEISEKVCKECGFRFNEENQPLPEQYKQVEADIIGYHDIPKERLCIDIYGPKHVWIPYFVTELKQVPVLKLLTEMHFSEAMDKFGLTDISLKADVDERTTRLPSGYDTNDQGIVTIRQEWIRPWAFNIYHGDRAVIDKLRAQYPSGAYAIFLDDVLIELYEESLDERWTVLYDPLAEFLHAVPEGADAVDIQDLINEMLNLTVDTVEHNIPEVFVNPKVIGIEQYEQRKAAPGNITPANPRPGLNLAADFFESHASSLSQEHNLFTQRLVELLQLIMGAQPTIYGGALKGGSNTAREYESSRAMALQRLAPLWRMAKTFYAQIMSLAVPLYAKMMREDEHYVSEVKEGQYINVVIEKKKLEGKVGEVKADTNEQIPVSWAERRDILMQLLNLQSPEIMALLSHPENALKLSQQLGADITIPGADDRAKQLSEISTLIKTNPMPNPAVEQDPMAMQAAQMGMMPMQISSVQIDAELDNHQIELDTCLSWLKSHIGLTIKSVNRAAWDNVRLHAMEHRQALMQQQMQQMQQQMQMQQQIGSAQSAPPQQQKPPQQM